MSIIVLGDLIIDDYKVVDVTRISPEAPCMIGLAHDEYVRLGGAANVAANIFKLDNSVVLVGQGQHDTFFPLLNTLGMPFLLYQGQHSIKTRFIDHKSRTQLFRYDIEKIIAQDSREDLVEYSSFIDSLNFPSYDTCVIVDYMKGMIRYNDVKRLEGCKVNIVSTKNKKPHRLLPKISKTRYQPINILIVNGKEFAEAQPIIGYQYVVRTEGDKGISVFKYRAVSDDWSESSLLVHIQGLKVDVFDVTGAGDTVTAVIAHCLDRMGFSEENLIRACFCANIEASKVVTKCGTAVLETPSDTILTKFRTAPCCKSKDEAICSNAEI
jgi:D-beta-D-heptose 7-phosphate kinase/D-beta-D-heptose 1-phosphate adenosyltransferase